MKINATIILILITILCTTTANPSTASTQHCEAYQNKINRLQNLNARGGKAKQLESRRQQINRYETELYKCSNIHKIQIVHNNQKRKTKTVHQKLRPSKIENAKLQQLTKTCNYWIEQHNQTPSWDNSNFRDTACRAADENEDVADNPTPHIAPNVRKLKDCIKPNNVIDDEVNECMKGIKDANWKNIN